jgi:hypothetical protein
MIAKMMNNPLGYISDQFPENLAGEGPKTA